MDDPKVVTEISNRDSTAVPGTIEVSIIHGTGVNRITRRIELDLDETISEVKDIISETLHLDSGQEMAGEDDSYAFSLFVPFSMSEVAEEGVWITNDDETLRSYGVANDCTIIVDPSEKKKPSVSRPRPSICTWDKPSTSTYVDITFLFSSKTGSKDQSEFALLVDNSSLVSSVKMNILRTIEGSTGEKLDTHDYELFLKTGPGNYGEYLDPDCYVSAYKLLPGSTLYVRWPKNVEIPWNEVMMEGELVKIGALRKNWKKRWFVLKGSYLLYYMNQNAYLQGAAPRGTIPIKNIININRIEDHDIFIEVSEPKQRKYVMHTPDMSTSVGRANLEKWKHCITMQFLSLCLKTGKTKDISDFVGRAGLLLERHMATGRYFAEYLITQYDENLLCAILGFLKDIRLLEFKGPENRTLLHYAAQRSRQLAKVIRAILSLGVNPVVYDSNGRLPFDIAIDAGYAPSMAAFMSSDVDTTYFYLQRHPDIFNNHPDVLISDYGFDILATNDEDKSVVDLAFDDYDDELVKKCIENGGEITPDGSEAKLKWKRYSAELREQAALNSGDSYAE